MYSVSADYKTQINKQVRNLSYIKVFFDIVDPDAVPATTLSTNGAGELGYSELDKTILDDAVSKKYATFEHNQFILDGSLVLPPYGAEPIDYYQGYVSSLMSDSNGYFSTNPSITINFSDYFQFFGLTFLFNTIVECYPTDFRIKVYNDLTLVDEFLYHPTSSEFGTPDQIPTTGFCNKVEIYFERTCIPYRRAQLETMLFGVRKTFDDNTITDSTWTREVDLLSSKLPINKFEFTAIDLERLYNPDNPEGIWPYLEKEQPIKLEYGYELDSGEIEWITACNLYSDGEIKVSSQGSISYASFSFTSYLNQLTDVYYGGKYNATPVSFYDLAVDVFTFAGVTDYIIDTALQSIYTTLPLPELPINEVLQLIANATRSVIYTDRSGNVVIEQFSVVVPEDFKFDFSNLKNIPTVSKIPVLYSVDTSYSFVAPDTADVELTKLDVSYPVNTEIRISYDPSYNHSIVTTGITVVTAPVYYARSMVITVVGTGTITINGRKLNINKNNISMVVNDKGFACPINNEIVNSYDEAVAYAQWVADILTNRNTYEAEDRGYPEIDPLNEIKIDTLFSTDLNAIILYSKIKYNGTLSGNTKYLALEV